MPEEALLVRTLVELADNLVDDFDVVDLLTLLSDRCVEALDVASAGVMLATASGHLQVVASSSDRMRTLELFQLQSDEGPCVDCYRTGTPIVNHELTVTNGRWPRFTPQALRAGFRSTHSLPMRLRGRTIGALNLFRIDGGTLNDADVVAAQALADVATIAILQHRTAVDAQTVNNQLNGALNSRIIIEQAKGIISEATGVDVDDGFQRLRNHARNHNRRLTDLARDITQKAIAPRSLDPLPPDGPKRPTAAP
jgi:GAF domain-containing protein